MPIPNNMKQITECALTLIEKQDKMEQKKNFNYTKPADAQVKPQMTGQRVTFDQNGELVVLTNKGKLDAKGKQEVVMEGIFTINARDLSKLLSAVSDIKFKEESYFRGSDGTLVTFFNPEKDVQDLIAANKNLDEICHEATDLADGYKAKFLNISTQAADFNRTRHFWERKLVLNPEEDNE